MNEFAPNNEFVPGSARLEASATTPLGRIDVVQFQHFSEGQLFDCEVSAGPAGSGVVCNPVGFNDALDGSAMAVSTGGGSDTWSAGTIRVTPEVTTIVAVADDGTRYAIVPAAGYGYVVWPTVRGNLALTALGADGAALGTAEITSTVGGPFGG
jgi:hypothetical protein